MEVWRVVAGLLVPGPVVSTGTEAVPIKKKPIPIILARDVWDRQWVGRRAICHCDVEE